MSGWLAPVTLETNDLRLEPLGEQHADGLAIASADGELWRLWYTTVPAPEQIAEYLAKASQQLAQGVSVPFAVCDKASGEVLGCTRYCNIDSVNQRTEIGYTWYARRVHRTAVNTQCKLALLKHAFETLDAIAVEFRTHWHNRASRAAIERLGAKRDGVLRNHQRLADGSYRDTVVYSIINAEWPAVRRSLEFALNR